MKLFANGGDVDLIPGLGRSAAEGNGNPLYLTSKYSFLGNPMDKEVWWGYSPWGHKESDMT